MSEWKMILQIHPGKIEIIRLTLLGELDVFCFDGFAACVCCKSCRLFAQVSNVCLGYFDKSICCVLSDTFCTCFLCDSDNCGFGNSVIL